MATADGLPPDSLTLLRNAIAAETLPIPTSHPDASNIADIDVPFAQATHLVFNSSSAEDGAQHISIPLWQPTRFISAARQKPLNLREIYFCWLNKDTSAMDYLSGTQRLNIDLQQQAGKEEAVTNLVFGEKLELVDWLSGNRTDAETEFIKSLDDNKQTRLEADGAALTAAGGEDVEMRDTGLSDAAARKREEDRLREIYAGERKMGDHNTVLRGIKIQNFNDIRNYSKLFLQKSRPDQQKASAAPLTNNPTIRAPVKPASGRRPEPIILLSPSASSLIRMPNVKSFLNDGIYTPPESGSAANILHLTRTLPSIDPSKPLRFILVDSPENFRPDYWQRVVAVFTTGQAWQFKNYKWQTPAELFSHVVGVYVGWKGEVVPQSVRDWGRGVKSVGIDKGQQRWRDRETVEEIWSAIEGRMAAMGWGKEVR